VKKLENNLICPDSLKKAISLIDTEKLLTSQERDILEEAIDKAFFPQGRELLSSLGEAVGF